jgi:AcrR family transcriptional regulator
LRAAEQVFARYGYEGARMDEIARQAKVEKANIYYYYDGKTELYRDLLNALTQDFVARLGGFLDETHDHPAARIDRLVDVVFGFIAEHETLVSVAMAEIVHPPSREHGGPTLGNALRNLEQLALAVLQREMDAGHFRRANVPQLMLSLQGVLFYAFMLPEERVKQLTGKRRFDPEALAERQTGVREAWRALLLPNG